MERLTCKEIAQILGIRPEKKTQCWDTAIAKVRKVFRLHPQEVLELLLYGD